MFPVVDNGRLLGCVTTRQLKDMPREQWGATTVLSLLEKCSPANSITPETDAMRALAKMNQTGASRLMVVSGERLIGIITLKDMLQFLSLKMELEENSR